VAPGRPALPAPADAAAPALDIYRNVRIEAQFQALRYFCIAGTDHPDHATQARLIHRYIAWRNSHLDNPRLRQLVRRANTANVA